MNRSFSGDMVKSQTRCSSRKIVIWAVRAGTSVAAILLHSGIGRAKQAVVDSSQIGGFGTGSGPSLESTAF
jgi:hypothetical protein